MEVDDANHELNLFPNYAINGSAEKKHLCAKTEKFSCETTKSTIELVYLGILSIKYFRKIERIIIVITSKCIQTQTIPLKIYHIVFVYDTSLQFNFYSI